MAYKLLSYKNDYRVTKILVAAEYAGMEIDVPNFDLQKETATIDFKSKSPYGKIPVFDTPNGSLFDVGAILRYVGRSRFDSGLYGSTFYQSGQVDQWLEFVTSDVDVARGIWLLPVLGQLRFEEIAYENSKRDVANIMNVLNKHLLHNTFMVGNNITLADISLSISLLELYQRVFSPEYLESYPNVTRWFLTCVNQPEFLRIVSKVELAKEEQLAPRPKSDKDAHEKKTDKKEKKK